MIWEQNNIVGGGTRWQLYAVDHADRRTLLATAVRLPGTKTRVFWRGGETGDFSLVAEASRAIEARHPGADRIPGMSDEEYARGARA